MLGRYIEIPKKSEGAEAGLCVFVGYLFELLFH